MSEKIRNRKHEAHTWFDQLWTNHEERDKYYIRLGEEMNLSYEDCHFSKMSDAAIYHMAGDSIVVTVLMSIFSQLIYENDEHKQIVKEYIKKGIIEK